jgi:hypothetical protein
MKKELLCINGFFLSQAAAGKVAVMGIENMNVCILWEKKGI